MESLVSRPPEAYSSLIAFELLILRSRSPWLDAVAEVSSALMVKDDSFQKFAWILVSSGLFLLQGSNRTC